jgi:SAM-dependent methyltransferase
MSTDPIPPGDSTSKAPDGARAPGKWTDPGFLRNVQYATAANLTARQAIYAYQQPRVSLHDWALDLAELEGDETILDVGCGNGSYLTALQRRGHAGLTIGMDFSAGMLSSTRQLRGPREPQPTVQGDAVALPFADGCAGVALAMHMLYHVPDRPRALAELRRVVRPRGRVLIVLNGSGHQEELRRLLRRALVDAGQATVGVAGESLDLDGGEELASRFFAVERHEFRGELVVPDPAPVLAYVRSMNFQQPGNLEESDIFRTIEDAVSDRIAAEGAFHMSTACGCLVCS